MNYVTAEQLKNAFIVGAARLEENKDIINELNVFPVPDGDTGTNMSMTVASAVEELKKLDSDEPKVICKAISQGALRGARGNSGVILSQLFRGFYKVIKTADQVDPCVFAEALKKATETAYKAVMKPKEGTILTIAKAISDRAGELCNEIEDFPGFYDELVKGAEEMLERTPDMLPALKQAGVVDSGGTGLIEILKGAADYIAGRVTEVPDFKLNSGPKSEAKVSSYKLKLEFFPETRLEANEIQDIKVYLKSIGSLDTFDSFDDYFQLEMISSEPGRAITKLLKSGSIDNVKLKPSKSEAKKDFAESHKVQKVEAKKPIGFVAISVGEGMDGIFEGLGADYIIKGGQTMNPSTEDILSAVEKVNADSVFVLPNNKNIQLAAKQAAELTKNKEVIVIPTATIPEGICALINFQPEKSAKENRITMEEEITLIRSGEVTYAVRDTMVDDKDIRQGDFMGIGMGKMQSVEKNIEDCIVKLVDALADEESSLLSLYYGKDVTEKDARKTADMLRERFPALEVEMQMGGQPVYYYVLSVE